MLKIILMTEEEFYKKKIFDKVGITQFKQQFPDLANSIQLWYKSERYHDIQEKKSKLTTKLKEMTKDGELSNEKLYNLFQWFDATPAVCYYCSLPENALKELHNQLGHLNKRFPQRGKSLEIDRKQADLPYSNIENLVLACYWCNNAKTDTFTEEEFEQLGLVIKRIWEKRLNRQL
jgi:5-methylcytosine-specific restriction endonuclease McrA